MSNPKAYRLQAIMIASEGENISRTPTTRNGHLVFETEIRGEVADVVTHSHNNGWHFIQQVHEHANSHDERFLSELHRLEKENPILSTHSIPI